MAQITVLHVAESFAGGTLTSVSRLVRGLEAPFQHAVLHGMREDTTPDFAARFPADAELVRWDIMRNVAASAGRAMAHLRAVVAERRPDIIHAHSTKAGFLVRLSNVWRRAPVLYSPRGYAFLRTDVPAPVRGAFWLAEAAMARRPHLTVACGRNEARLARQLGTQPAFINNMVDLQVLGPLRAGHGAGAALRVAMLGQIAPAKNFPLFAGIAAACPRMQFTWVGGGEVPQGVLLPPNLTMTGMLPHRAALERLAAHDVYLHTSCWEGLSNAVLEALALGMPMIVSPVSGEVVETGPLANGAVCRKTPDYVDALNRLASDRALLALYAANSRRLAEDRYSSTRVLQQWRDLYRAQAGR